MAWAGLVQVVVVAVRNEGVGFLAMMFDEPKGSGGELS
jgi:hypothetical protein